MSIKDKVKLFKTYPWNHYEYAVGHPTFVGSLDELNVKEGIAELCLRVMEGILCDAEGKVAFVKQTVTSLGYLQRLCGYSGGVHKKEYFPLVVLEKLRLGRWVFRRGDLEKADKFRQKHNIDLIGPRAISSYDLRGEFVR